MKLILVLFESYRVLFRPLYFFDRVLFPNFFELLPKSR